MDIFLSLAQKGAEVVVTKAVESALSSDKPSNPTMVTTNDPSSKYDKFGYEVGRRYDSVSFNDADPKYGRYRYEGGWFGGVGADGNGKYTFQTGEVLEV
jgi:hypothetical protein